MANWRARPTCCLPTGTREEFLMSKIHPTAIIDPGAEVGEEVEIGPYCVIGPHVKLGVGTRLMSHVVIDGWTSHRGRLYDLPVCEHRTADPGLEVQGRRFARGDRRPNDDPRIRDGQCGHERWRRDDGRFGLSHHGLRAYCARLSRRQRRDHGAIAQRWPVIFTSRTKRSSADSAAVHQFVRMGRLELSSAAVRN